MEDKRTLFPRTNFLLAATRKRLLAMKGQDGNYQSFDPVDQIIKKITEMIGALIAIADDGSTQNGFISFHWKTIGDGVKDTCVPKVIQDIV